MASIREFLVQVERLDHPDFMYSCFFLDNRIFFLDNRQADFLIPEASMDMPSNWEVVSKGSGLVRN